MRGLESPKWSTSAGLAVTLINQDAATHCLLDSCLAKVAFEREQLSNCFCTETAQITKQSKYSNIVSRHETGFWLTEASNKPTIRRFALRSIALTLGAVPPMNSAFSSSPKHIFQAMNDKCGNNLPPIPWVLVCLFTLLSLAQDSLIPHTWQSHRFSRQSCLWAAPHRCGRSAPAAVRRLSCPFQDSQL